MEVEAQRISQEILRNIDEFAEKTEGFETYIYRIKKTEAGKCMFLENNLCSIYRTRPLICVFYPFELKKIGSQRYAFAYTDECPAIGKGPQFKRNRFKKLFERAMKTSEC